MVLLCELASWQASEHASANATCRGVANWALVLSVTPFLRAFSPWKQHSFSVYSLMWSFFLHPGSCHTSNLLRLYHNVSSTGGERQHATAHHVTHRVRVEHSHKGNDLWMSQVLDGLTIQWLGGPHFAYIYIYIFVI